MTVFKHERNLREVNLRDSIIFFLNGRRVEVGPDLAGLSLAEYLRYERGLTGTKIVCSEGDCGACSVLRYFPISKKNTPPLFVAINSCITHVSQMDGSSLITVEALAPDQASVLSPVQKSMINCHASQCGFCTPGFVVALTGLVEKKVTTGDAGLIGPQEAKNSMTGNLCRCTGYQPLIDAACSIDLSQCESLSKRFYSKKQDQELKKIISTPTLVESGDFSFFAPTHINEAVQYLNQRADVKLVAAATDLGVLHNKRKARLKNTLSLHLLGELYEIKKLKNNRISVGARVTLEKLRNAVKETIPEFARFLDIFASPQIKNVATLIGNVANASPIADTPPFLMVAKAQVKIVGAQGTRSVAIEDFFLAYRKTSLKPGEFISAIEFDAPTNNERLKLYKISERKDLDISTVNAAFRLQWANEQNIEIKDLLIAFGGVAATPLRCYKTEKLFKDAKLSEGLFKKASLSLQSEMAPLGDVRGSSAFRRVLVHNLLRKFLSEDL